MEAITEFFLSLLSLDAAIEYLKTVPAPIILIFAFALTFTENLFPPAPCDTALMFIGTLVAFGTVSFLPLLATASAGSILGFLFVFWLGREFGIKILESKRFKFINYRSLEKARGWLNKRGYWIIVANRFLSGTRAIISFAAGISKMKILPTTLLAAISAIIWNIVLINIGRFLGDNWEEGIEYLGTYSQIVIPLFLVLFVFFIVRFVLKRKKRREAKDRLREEVATSKSEGAS